MVVKFFLCGKGRCRRGRGRFYWGMVRKKIITGCCDLGVGGDIMYVVSCLCCHGLY